MFKLFNPFTWFAKSNTKVAEQKKYLALCGHESQESDAVSAFGVTIETKVPIIYGKIEYCHKCLEKMVIRCAWCGKPIFIGDPITLYTPNKNFKAPEWATIHQKEPLQLVGCGRSSCADSGADYCGHWVPPGAVYRQASALEIAIANPGCAVVSSNNNGKRKVEIIKNPRND